MERLLVLDVNGLLCQKVQKNSREVVDLKLDFYDIIFRPGCREFLKTCYQRFTVGFFSSTTKKNAGAVLDLLLNEEQKEATLFKWFRNRTSLDPDLEGISCHPSWDLSEFHELKIETHSTVKYLSVVLNSPKLNEKRIYSFKNTLICDNSSGKLRFNPKENCVIVETFTGQEDDKVLFSLADEIERRFEQLGQVGPF